MSGPFIRRELDLHVLKQSLHAQLSISALLDEEPNPIDIASQNDRIVCDPFTSSEDVQLNDNGKYLGPPSTETTYEKRDNSKMDFTSNDSSQLHVLASEMFSNQNKFDMIPLSNVRSTHFLPYSENEIEILRLRPETGITDFVRAGIIWKAVEREQEPASRKRDRTAPNLPSSDCILELLLCQFFNENNSNTDDDAIIVHTVDAILYHYAHDSHKINPFSSWSGAGGKGLLRTMDQSMTKSRENEIQPSWRSFYEREIIGSGQNEKGTSAGSWKMKRGQKITCCLLRWARHMQINNRNRWKDRGGLEQMLDHCNHQPRLPNDIEFVSETMRLLAARWREAIDAKSIDSNLTTRRSVRSPSTKNATIRYVHVSKELPVKRSRGCPQGKRSSRKIGRPQVKRSPGKNGRPPAKRRSPGKNGRPPGRAGDPPRRKVGRPPKSRGRSKNIVTLPQASP